MENDKQPTLDNGHDLPISTRLSQWHEWTRILTIWHSSLWLLWHYSLSVLWLPPLLKLLAPPFSLTASLLLLKNMAALVPLLLVSGSMLVLVLKPLLPMVSPTSWKSLLSRYVVNRTWVYRKEVVALWIGRKVTLMIFSLGIEQGCCLWKVGWWFECQHFSWTNLLRQSS